MTAIIGPNGAGKSTLLKGSLGIVKPLAGEARLFGAPFARVRERVAYVPQRASVDWDFPARVIDVVMMGLYARKRWFQLFNAQDREAARAALARVGMESFADRQIGALSGGQQQRVFLARALAEDADLFILDEPFAGVDAATEAAIIGVLKTLQAVGRTIIAVHHDLSTVPEYFDRVLMINRRVIAEGSVHATFTDAHIAETYAARVPGHSIARAGVGVA
jgi:manganese/zinc/iron transport system ATP- binding protein